jgi:hypothetical protein
MILSRFVKLCSHAQKDLRSGKAPIRPHPIQDVINGVKSFEMQELVRRLFQLLVEYQPSKYDGSVLLFLSAELPDSEYERKWKVFADNLKTHQFLGTPENPTSHESFIRGDRVNLFAKTLKEQVDLLV